MMRLLRAELHRFLARDLVRVFAVAVLVAIAIGCIITAVNSKAAEPDDAFYRSELQHCLEGRMVPERRIPARYDSLEEFCADQVRPEYYGAGDQRFELRSVPTILESGGILTVIGGLLLGASFVGAEWHAGTMTTLLTWEPRRLRVLGAKAVVTAVCTFVVMAALTAVFALGLALVASTRGVTDGLGDHFLRSVAGTTARIAACSAAGALVGMAIAMVARNTAAAVGAGFAYLAIIEGLIRGLRPGWQHYLLADNIAVVITGSGSGIMETPVTIAYSAATIATWIAVLMTLAAVTFRARDVT